MGFPAAALTDRNGLYAAMAFSDACMASGVQPIIGTMLGVCRPDMPEGVEAPLDWLALYAQDKTGYPNPCAPVSRAHPDRSEERSVGEECGNKFRTRLSASHLKKTKTVQLVKYSRYINKPKDKNIQLKQRKILTY